MQTQKNLILLAVIFIVLEDYTGKEAEIKLV